MYLSKLACPYTKDGTLHTNGKKKKTDKTTDKNYSDTTDQSCWGLESGEGLSEKEHEGSFFW